MARRKKEKKKSPIDKWVEALMKFHDGQSDIPSPFHEEGKIKTAFIIYDKEKKLGIGTAWCTKTLRSIGLGIRVMPDNIQYVTEEEFNKINSSLLKLDGLLDFKH